MKTNTPPIGFKPAIITDFDGTITEMDSLRLLLETFGPPDWEEFEEEYARGNITATEALENEMQMLELSIEKVIGFTRNNISIDSTFIPFVDWCREENIPLTIVSSNFESIIKSILYTFGLKDLNVQSNNISEREGVLYIIPGELKNPECKACHLCKTLAVREFRKKGYTTIYIGDGLTDRCPAWESDIIFARSKLRAALTRLKINHLELINFSQVKKQIQAWIKAGTLSSFFTNNAYRKEEKNPFFVV
jgi:2,3-diketo-5-methylthio-1-phosphopentane phosphatase